MERRDTSLNSGSSGGSLEKLAVRKLSNFGNGKVNFKIRQAVSIGDSVDLEEHESFVETHGQGWLNGLLGPIDESEEMEGGGSQLADGQ
jgi:hypothetical protein